MKVLELLFQLGILFSAFAFLWFWIQLLIVFLVPTSIRLQLRYFLQLLHSLFSRGPGVKILANGKSTLGIQCHVRNCNAHLFSVSHPQYSLP